MVLHQKSQYEIPKMEEISHGTKILLHHPQFFNPDNPIHKSKWFLPLCIQKMNSPVCLFLLLKILFRTTFVLVSPTLLKLYPGPAPSELFITTLGPVGRLLLNGSFVCNTGIDCFITKVLGWLIEGCWLLLFKLFSMIDCDNYISIEIMHVNIYAILKDCENYIIWK